MTLTSQEDECYSQQAMYRLFLFCAMISAMLASCAQLSPRGGEPGGVVVLDIGHFIGSEGAKSPEPIAGRYLRECSFWYQYAGEVKSVVRRAGYSCVITNRGNAPTTEPLATYARRNGVVHLRKPDIAGARYPSHYFPDRVASGMVSADYAVWKRASCAVFLHHNSSGSRRWQQGGSPSIILCNKYNGHALANDLCYALNTEILNHGMPNGGRECKIQVRSVDADRAAGWLNTCDDAGIPAAVIEAAFLNNRGHAAFLAQDANARRYAQAIGHGIVRYLRQHSGGSRHYRQDPDAPDEGSFGYAPESRLLDVPGAKRLLH